LFDGRPDQVWSGRAIQNDTCRRNGMSDLLQSIAMQPVVENRSGSLGNRESFEKKLRLGV
jgi:hypothetical protein